MFGPKCKHCLELAANTETFPFCLRCAYCRSRKHVLPALFDGTLPVFCPLCSPKKWNEEWKRKLKVFTRNLVKRDSNHGSKIKEKEGGALGYAKH